MPNFTTEDLLVYIYNEMDPMMAKELELALQTDWALNQKYLVLIEARQKLNRIKLSSPRTSTINTILHYAGTKLPVSN